MKLIERTAYLSEMLELADTPDIKVITGVRRSGKSKLLEALAQKISERQPDANIIRINYNLTDFEDILDYRSMEAYVEERYVPGRQNYLFIDEVQMCRSFEKAINSLHAREKYSIFVTGSNAFLQSSDLATLFVGRTYETPSTRSPSGSTSLLSVPEHLRQPDQLHLGWGHGGIVHVQDRGAEAALYRFRGS